MMVVEDWATGVVDRTLGGRLGDESRHLVSACASGPAAAVLVGSQVEGLITRAHGVGQSLGRSLMATAAAEGWISLLVPHGMLMVAAREVPYAGCLFFLSAKIRAALEPPEGAAAPLATRVPRDLLAACVCACVAGPLSQVPCTIAAYQQAHALGIGAACAAISRTGIGFFAGLTARTASARRLALRLPVHDGGAAAGGGAIVSAAVILSPILSRIDPAQGPPVRGATVLSLAHERIPRRPRRASTHTHT